MDREQVRALLEAARDYVNAAGLAEFGAEECERAENAAIDKAVTVLGERR